MITNELRSGMSMATLLALVWAVAAAIRPTATFHLAPILIAGIGPVVLRRAELPSRVSAALAGAVLAVLTALVLAALGFLDGPTLLPYGGALAEAMTFVVIGAIGGVIATSIPAAGSEA